MSNEELQKQEAIVTPWSVKGKIDYTRLVKEFGTELITKELMERFENVTGKPLHPWIKRGIFFSHRGLEKILDAYENGECIFLYTGRGPSNDMHIGHMIPFIFTKWLQDVFDCPLVIQISDEEKYYFKNLEFETTHELGRENAKDIIAFGFDPEKTFIFSNRDYRMEVFEYEKFVSTIKKTVSAKQVSKVFGFGEYVIDKNGVENYVFKEDVTVGMMDWPFYQTAAAFYKAFPHIFNDQPAFCLVPYAIDQDNYFRMGRDIASKMKMMKPCSIISSFLDPIKGSGKMSSSTGQEGTIFLTDTPEIIRSKITKYAFSGSRGNGSLEDHKKYGGDVETDIPCKYLKYFEYDDERYNSICNGFSSGKITCSETKKMLADKLIEIVTDHQNKRSKVTDELLLKFYDRKPMNTTINSTINRNLNENEKKVYEMLEELKIKHNTLYHKQVKSEEDEYDLATRVKGCIPKCLVMQDSNKETYLVITESKSKIDGKVLSKLIGKPKLHLVDKSFIDNKFGISFDSLSIFIIQENKMTVVIDKSLANQHFVNFRPFRNDAFTSFSYGNLIKFIESSNCEILYFEK